MGAGIILFIILFIIYVVAFIFTFTKPNNKRQRIGCIATPIVILGSIIGYGLLSDYLYLQKEKRHPEYTHISFISPIKEVKNSITELKSVLNFKRWPYWMKGKPISFKDLLTWKYIPLDSVFTNDSIGLNNIKFLEMNSINSFELISNSFFVTYRDSISKSEGLYYELLQLKDISIDSSQFRINQFDTIDYKDGLYLLIKKSLN